MSKTIQYLAYYLPQFHPIPENDLWWGKGFTEWTNVKKAKPLFKGHQQPIVPGELGYYDLLQPDVQEKQAVLAEQYGIDGFIYYQYWFGHGKMLLEKPAELMLSNKNITLPFCFCWANETWKGIWHGLDNPSVLIEQTYQGEAGYKQYFDYLLPFFKDERYIKVDNKPMFHVYRMDDIPDLTLFIATFNALAVANGFNGIHLVATGSPSTTTLERNDIYAYVGLDAFSTMRYSSGNFFKQSTYLGKIEAKIKYELGLTSFDGRRKTPIKVNYKKGVLKFTANFDSDKYVQCVFPNWDNSPRSGLKSLIFTDSNPDEWSIHLQKAKDALKKHPKNPPYIVIKSWNEWAEGNYLEPDEKWGRAWLEVVKNVKKN